MNAKRAETAETERLLRAERTEIEGITVDYALSRGKTAYSLRVEGAHREETLTDYTENPLLAEAFYLLVCEERLLPGTLTDLWEEWQAAERKR